MLSPEEWRDRWQVRQARNGDRRAFESLYQRHGRRVFGMLLRLTGNASDAEDLTQETFLSVYQTLAQWRGKGRFSTYLCGIAYRKFNDSRRQRVAEPTDEVAEVADTDADPLRHLSIRERARALEAAIALLPDGCRETFILVRIEEITYREAAVILEIPIGTVQSRLFRANRLLQKSLSEWTPGASEPLTSSEDALMRPDFEKGVIPHAMR